MLEIEFRMLWFLPPTTAGGKPIDRLELRVTSVLLLDLDNDLRNKSRSDDDDWDEAEDALRWRCIRVGSISVIFASRANTDRTGENLVRYLF